MTITAWLFLITFSSTLAYIIYLIFQSYEIGVLYHIAVIGKLCEHIAPIGTTCKGTKLRLVKVSFRSPSRMI